MTAEGKAIRMYKGKHNNEISIEELRSEIAQCLQIENLNFLIGAGCSSFRSEDGEEHAIPTMVGLAKQFYETHPDFKVEKKHAVDLFPDNLEALINHLVSLGNIVTSDKKKTELSNKIKTINEFIFEKVCVTVQLASHYFNSIKSFI